MKLIIWESTYTKAKGGGTMLLQDEDAEKEVKRLDKQWPGIIHRAIYKRELLDAHTATPAPES